MPADCVAQGYDWYGCEVDGCSEKQKQNFTDDLGGHKYGNWTTTKDATCTTAGVETRVCANNAKHVDTKEIPALDHDFAISSTVKKATCTNEGEELLSCARKGCTESKTQVIPKTAHKYGDPVSDGKVTCTTNGKKTSTCSACGYKKEEVEEAPGHKFINYISNNNASCGKNATQTATCENCTEKDTQEIENSALAHDFKDEVCTRCSEYSPNVHVTEGLEYQEYDNGYIVIGPGTVTTHEDSFAADVNLIIPATHEGKPVIGIRGDALYSCHGLITVTIPNTVKFIGNGAFHGSRKLNKVVLPDSLLRIEPNAFQYCSSLTSIHIPKNVNEIGVGAFEGCGVLESITVANDNQYFSGKGNCIVEKSTKTLIAGCQNTIIPTDGSVTSIGERAFERHSRLTSINIPYGVTSIGYLAFNSVSTLKTVTIPNTLKTIENQAFGYCNMLSAVNYTGTAEEWNNINIGSNNEKLVNASRTYASTELDFAEIKKGNTVVAYKVLLKGTTVFTDTLIIPTTHNGLPVTEIERDYSAGKIYDTPVKTLIIPQGITTISGGAFLNFHSLTTVIIADSVTFIGEGAFENCEKLSTVLMSGGVQEIGDMAFAQCNALTQITLPKTLTKLGTFVLQQTNITTVYYEGTQTDWDKITFGTVLVSSGEITGNEVWLGKIVYNG